MRFAVKNEMNGSVRFALLTVRLINGTVTVALAVKNGTVKKTENGTVRTRYGTVTVTNSDPLLYKKYFFTLNRAVKMGYSCKFTEKRQI